MTNADQEVVTEELDDEAQEAVQTLEETLGRIGRAQAAHNFMTVSDAVVLLIDVYRWSQLRIGQTFGASQPTVSNYYSLRLLIPELRERAKLDEMSKNAAVWLSKMTPEKQQEIYEDTKDDTSISQARVKQEMQTNVEALPIGNIPAPEAYEQHSRRVVLQLSSGQRTTLITVGVVELSKEGVTYQIVSQEAE
jgi:predicted transcriptional regulator